MGNNQQIQQQEEQKQYFQSVQDEMGLLVEQFNKVKQIQNPSLFEIDLITNITQGIDTLNNYLNNSKIYIVFMGTTSSGKSTFLNALLGHQLLPSRNQDCTNQISQIGHQNANAHGNTQFTINQKEFLQLEKAYSELKTLRDSPNMDKINIKTHSLSHTTLSKDLQNRVYFIDTPGIKLTDDCSDEKYVQQFDKINEQIELDEYTKRINVWVSDYTTFDRDKKIQKKILESLKIKVEQNQQQQQNQDNNQIQQSIGESQLFYIINKFDQRNSEDKPIQDYKEEIENVFNSDNIFKISALNALNYNTMIYGTKDAKNNFINQFYQTNKQNMNFNKESQARDHCENNIKNNDKIMKNQDFNEFISKMSLQIKRVLDELFHHLFNDLNQKIQYLKFGEEFKEAKQKLTQLHKNKISQFWSNYDQKNLVNYNQELQKQKNIFDKQVQQLITYVKNKIENQASQAIFESISIYPIVGLDELNKNFHIKTFQSKNELFNDLTSIFQQEQQSSIIIKRCRIIFQLMEECIYEQKKQFVKKQAEELQLKLGITVNSFFYQKAFELQNTGIVNFSSIVGGEYQRTIANINASVIGREILEKDILTTVIAVTSAAVTASFTRMNIIAGIATAVCIVGIASIAGGILWLYYGCEQHIVKNNLKQKLDDWNQSLNSQSQDLVINYINIYDKKLLEIRSLME